MQLEKYRIAIREVISQKALIGETKKQFAN